MSRTLDLVVFGATGFTGALVAEVVQQLCAAGDPLRWAIAGRSAERLAALRERIGAPASLPLIVADAADAAALARLAAQCRAVITTAGPYQRHGQALVTACAHAGTDYVDLCGEPAWMARMIPRLQPPAAASGARIVFSCGFDSVPFELGVVFLQQQALQRLGAPLQRVDARVKTIRGGLSGGTLASALATAEAAVRDPETARLMADPFALTPGFRGPPQPDGRAAEHEGGARSWSVPFAMAPINTKNVHRTNFLRGHPWGRGFAYGERLRVGSELQALALVQAARLLHLALGSSAVRTLLQRFVLPPGRGPGPARRASGRYELLFLGRGADGRTLDGRVTGDGDPGYASTSRMVVQCALALLRDVDRTMTPGGVWTPGAALGLVLLPRLQRHAGLTFDVVG